MNKRVIFRLLGVGLAVILTLGGLGLYKIHTLKVQTQNLLNAKLANLAKESLQKDIEVSYQPFECSGLVFVECKNKEIAFRSSLFTQNVLSFQNIKLEASEFDFKSLAFLISSDIVAPKIDGVEEYMEAFFPKHLKIRLKLSAQNQENYMLDSRFLLEANNIDYQEELNAVILSDELKSKGFFHAIENLDFLKEKTEIKNMILTFSSKGLNPKLLEIVRSKYGNWGEGIIGMMVGASMMQFEGNKEIQEVVAGLGALAMGEAKVMRVYITPTDPSSSIPDIEANPNEIFEILSEKYSIETKLEQ